MSARERRFVGLSREGNNEREEGHELNTKCINAEAERKEQREKNRKKRGRRRTYVPSLCVNGVGPTILDNNNGDAISNQCALLLQR